MKKVKMKSLAAGPDYLFRENAIVEVPEKVAQAWVAAGYAVFYDGPARVSGRYDPETAVASPPETAAAGKAAKKADRPKGKAAKKADSAENPAEGDA